MKPVFDENGLATEPGEIRCYYYDAATSEYMGWSDEYINLGVSMPGHSTDIEPGDNETGYVARRFFLHRNAINFALSEGAKKTHSAQCKNERKECLLMLLLSRVTFVESRQADPIFESYITM